MARPYRRSPAAELQLVQRQAARLAHQLAALQQRATEIATAAPALVPPSRRAEADARRAAVLERRARSSRAWQPDGSALQ